MSTISKLFQKTVSGTTSQVPFSTTATYHGWVVVPLSKHVRFSDRASIIAIAQRILSHKKSSKATGEKVTINLNPNLGLKIESVRAVLKEEMLTQSVPEDWHIDNEDPDVLSFSFEEAKNPDFYEGDGADDSYASREGMELLSAEPNAIVCVVLSKDKGLCGVVTSSIDESGDACLGCDVLGFPSNKGSVAFAAAYRHLTTQFPQGYTVPPTVDPLDDTTSTTSTLSSGSSGSSSDSNSTLDTTHSTTSSTTSSIVETANTTDLHSPLRTISSPLAQTSHSADHAVEPSALLTNSGHFTHLSPRSYQSSPSGSPRGSPNASFRNSAKKLSPSTMTPSPTGSPKASPKSSRNWSTKLYRRGSPRSKQKKVLTGMSNVFVKRASSVDLSEVDSGYLRTETITQILQSEVNGERDTYLVCNCSTSPPSPTQSRVGFVAVQAS